MKGSTQRRRLAGFCALAGLLTLVTMAAGAPAQASAPASPPFRIVTADATELTRRIAADLHKRLLLVFASARAPTRRQLVVAIGPLALRDVLARPCDCALVSTYTSSQVWHALTAAVPAPRQLTMSAIFAEPAPADQLKLIELLFKRPVRVAALLSADTLFLKPVLGAAVNVEYFAAREDINRGLNRISQARVLLAVPDRRIYNADNIRNILLSTYRHNQAVIGFSADMVKAGALASTYSDLEHINAQVADVSADFLRTGALAPPQFPRYFSTIVNEGVARSLEVPVDAAAREFSNHPAPAPGLLLLLRPAGAIDDLLAPVEPRELLSPAFDARELTTRPGPWREVAP